MGEMAKAPTLKRALGLPMGLVIVVGNVIGSGIFLKPGAIAAEAGQFGLNPSPCGCLAECSVFWERCALPS